jgi:hypothetical protein
MQAEIAARERVKAADIAVEERGAEGARAEGQRETEAVGVGAG